MRVVTTGVSQVVLILAPVGRDADVAVSVLQTAGIVAQPCQSLSELSERLRAEGSSVGALLLTEESLASPMEYASLTEWLEHQDISYPSRPADEGHRSAFASSEPSWCSKCA